ncbi:hypothetical protein BDQ17DRAFT_1355511 [Cyathus striatus]|nr:hypothetical protein BDQ17DRAFT_1355511 [Cyathus striatus]
MDYSGRRKLLTRTQRANPMGSSWTNTPNGLVVCDIKLPFHCRGIHNLCERPAEFRYLYEPRGNMLAWTVGFDTRSLNLVALRTAEALYCIHSDGGSTEICGRWVGVFNLDNESIMLLDIGLYRLAQENLDHIPWSPAHDYKAREELVREVVIPSEVMDLHSWAKSMICVYSRRELKASISTIAPPTIKKPQEMPQGVWNVVAQCLDEDLNIQVNMSWVVGQLSAII